MLDKGGQIGKGNFFGVEYEGLIIYIIIWL